VLVFTGDLTKLANLVLEWDLAPEVAQGFETAELLQPGGKGLVLEQVLASGGKANSRGRSRWVEFQFMVHCPPGNVFVYK
jgi:hypothetical protein